jgi:hypothetical protein
VLVSMFSLLSPHFICQLERILALTWKCMLCSFSIFFVPSYASTTPCYRLNYTYLIVFLFLCFVLMYILQMRFDSTVSIVLSYFVKGHFFHQYKDIGTAVNIHTFNHVFLLLVLNMYEISVTCAVFSIGCATSHDIL